MEVEPTFGRVGRPRGDVEVKALNKEGRWPQRAPGVQPLGGVEHTFARNVGQEALERGSSP